MCDYVAIIAIIFLQKPNRLFTLLHYLQKDDYCTCGTTIISLIFFGIYYSDYCYYHTIICIIGIANYYSYYSI